MKQKRFQISLSVSLLVHAIIFGAIGLDLLRPQPPLLVREDSSVQFTLVAAPEESNAAPSAEKTETITPAPVEPLIKPTPQPIIPIPAETTAPQPAALVPAETKSAPPPKVEFSTPHLSAARPAEIRGDGSSLQPGLDATTQKAEVGVRAAPNYRKNPEPFYPLVARRRREQGLVMLNVEVTAQGRAAKVKLKQSSGYPLLDEAAVKAVRDWEFTPARRGSIAMESEIEVPVRFKLNE